MADWTRFDERSWTAGASAAYEASQSLDAACADADAAAAPPGGLAPVDQVVVQSFNELATPWRLRNEVSEHNLATIAQKMEETAMNYATAHQTSLEDIEAVFGGEEP